MNTILEFNKEKELLESLEPIIIKYAKEFNKNPRYIKTIHLTEKEFKKRHPELFK